ncbi:DUF2255 family protein [Gordonia sp. ABSL11-1]|uniref:DUF2255 family protein n=1 Tax=Gordonia sp. ABSL11-1 TaxID=3053924 RepID=UPI0025744C7D|nr:DUF2255 family protein [Gordonia sp. ABSL11-1]MDL9946485.1 DUF2255 family protein [Gordonia sp. ABSL11-1]
MTWTDDELDRIGGADELQVSSYGSDGTLRPFVTIWVVRTGGNLYIRSAYGRENGWYRRAVTSGRGQIRAGGVEKDVTFVEPTEDVHSALDDAYHAKYDRYGAKIVGTVVAPHGVGVTLRLDSED